MSERYTGASELEFLQAVLKRGFVNLPRMIFDYFVDLDLDYHVIGKLCSVLACVGSLGEGSFGAYTVSRQSLEGDYEHMRRLIDELRHHDIVECEESGDQITFSLTPLFSRLSVTWLHYRDHRELEEAGLTPHPAILMAERTMGRTLSDRDVQVIQEWIDLYHFDAEMVRAICREGASRGITHMSFLNRVATDWFESGIRSPEEAEAHSQKYKRTVAQYKSILPHLGLNRPATKAEQVVLEKWTKEWGFSDEVVIRACSAAVGMKHPIQYVNRVLESWREQGVRTLADVDQVEQKRRAAQTNLQKEPRTRRAPSRSNVILQREEKDDSYYDYLYKKYSD